MAHVAYYRGLVDAIARGVFVIALHSWLFACERKSLRYTTVGLYSEFDSPQ